jgi:hypothetical protein
MLRAFWQLPPRHRSLAIRLTCEIALRGKVVDSRTARTKGRIVNAMGESGSVVEAVCCVIEVQTAIPEKTANVSGEKRIVSGIGFDTSDTVTDGTTSSTTA